MTVNVYEVYEDILAQINKEHLTNYKLGNPLGEGKFVKVFEIFGYKDDDEYVGRFTLRPTTDDSWEWIKNKTELEYKLLTQKNIQEKYVGKLCKTYQSDEWYFSIQKKYITLPNYLRNELGKNPNKKKKELIFSKILYELSDALFYIHNYDYENSKGILLRDVKPENIMYDPRMDKCILCDFNIAREYNPKEYWAGTTMFVGTPEFMAPELLDGTEKYPNPRQDIYSLGASIFTLTTRKSPKEEVEGSNYKYKEISDDQKYNALKKSGLSKEFQNIIYCSIQADPEKRYQEADELFTYISSLYQSRYFEKKYEDTLTELKEQQAENEKLNARIESMNVKSSKKEKDTKKTLLEAEKKNTESLNKIEELNKKNSELKNQLISLEKKYEKEKKLSADYKEKNQKLIKTINAEKIKFNTDEIIAFIGLILCMGFSIAALLVSIFNPVFSGEKYRFLPMIFNLPMFYYLFSGKYSGKCLTWLIIFSASYSAGMWFRYIRIPTTYYYLDSIIYVTWSLCIAVLILEYCQKLKSKLKNIYVLPMCVFIILAIFSSFSLGLLSTNMDTAVGKHVSFGTYEQDGDLDNGEEELSWKIESKIQENFLILSCDKCIDYLPFNSEAQEDVTWADSSIRKWLNTTFLKSFSEEEQEVLAYRTIADSEEYVSLNEPDQFNLISKMPMPTEYAEQKYDNANYKTEKPWVYTNSIYKNYEETTLIKVINPGESKVGYMACELNGYIRPIIVVSKSDLDKYLKERE